LNAEIQSETDQFLVYLSLGSNIEPETNLPQAIQKLQTIFPLVAISSTWRTPAVGFEGDDFLNTVVLIKTGLSPSVLKSEILRPLEALLGRIRTKEKFSPRTIDIDILLYQDQLIDKELWSQPHLAVPLAEIIPNYLREETGETLEEIAQRLQSTSQIQIWNDT
jgi:2-amino-4-hydroxy-6-hydroxymethyldihydropteridine diphosphokinase